MSKISFHTTSLFLLFLLFFAAPITNLYSQQYNNWYFGRNAGLYFGNSGAPSTPTILTNNAMRSDEAAASISDENGNLLFYTNGVTVYNRLNQVMFNGDNLSGNISSCQVSIVPVPGSSTLFYIFTTDAVENDFAKGYQYSIVDMTGDFGNGEVTSKNNILWASGTERIATIRHANGIDIWVITNDNDSNIFRAWLVTCNGLQPAPVVSQSGVVMDQNILMNVGVLKGSPDGKMLCQTHFPLFAIADPNSSNFVQLFGFDNATGIVSNPRTITFPATNYNYCEFSPDSRILYLVRKDAKQLDQLEVKLPTLADILASRVTIPTGGSHYEIELAPDGKIYITLPGLSLAVINYPNNKGLACGFQRQKINVSPGSAYLGLPSHINDMTAFDDASNGFSYTIIDSCSGTIQFNAHAMLSGVISWSWDFGDGTTSNQQNPLHVFTNPKSNYIIRLKISSSTNCGGIIYRTKNLSPNGHIDTKVDYTFLNKCDSGYIRFTNTSDPLIQDGSIFSWDFGDGITSTELNPIHTYTDPGPHDVKLKLSTGSPCLDDSITYTVDFTSLSIDVIPDQTINLGESVLLTTIGPDDADYTWTPDTWLSSNVVKSPLATPNDNIIYKVTATNNDNCKSQDSVRITVVKPDDIDNIYVPGAFTPNNDGRNDLMKPFLPRTITLKKFSIFNRSGQMVFTTSDPQIGWDGKLKGLLQNSEVFVWILKAANEDGKLIERKGSFVLIR